MDAGGATLDCARIYSGGESEQIVGRVMDTTGCRDAIQLVTKVHPSQPNGLSPEGIRAQLTASLEALQVDRPLREQVVVHRLGEHRQLCHMARSQLLRAEKGVEALGRDNGALE